MSCEPHCIFVDGHAPPCFDKDGARIEPTAATSRDRDAPRAVGYDIAKPVIWALPFACPDCRAWGYAPVCVENTRMTTDEQVMYFVGKKHRELSGNCVRPPERILLGRLRRYDEPQQKWIFMLKKGEDENTQIDHQWPRWDQG